MVMEAVQPVGWDVMRLLMLYQKREMKMPVLEIQQYFLDAARAVSHLHSKGLVHCDLKAEQLLISGEEPFAAKLIDFGCATRIGLPFQGKRCRYMAPEVGSDCVTEKVDVFGLGVILHQMWLRFNIDDPNEGYFKLNTDTGKDNWLDEEEHIKKREWPSGKEDQVFKVALKSMLARDPQNRFSVEDLLKPEFSRPSFLDVSGLGYQGTLREEMKVEASTVTSRLILNSSIRPKVECVAMKVREDMVGKTFGELNMKVEKRMLVLLVERKERGSHRRDFITCPNIKTRFEEEDWLYVAGDVDEIGIRQKLADETGTSLSFFRPFFPEFDQFEFPENCHYAIVGPVSFCRNPGQKALDLRNTFNINLVAIKREDGTIIGPIDLGPETEILPGDVGVVGRVQATSGFSKSIFTLAHLRKLQTEQLMVSTEASVQKRREDDLKSRNAAVARALLDGRRLQRAKSCPQFGSFT